MIRTQLLNPDKTYNVQTQIERERIKIERERIKIEKERNRFKDMRPDTRTSREPLPVSWSLLAAPLAPAKSA